MIEVNCVEQLSGALESLRGKPIGFVPTMGFLHDGHLSLIRQAKKNAGDGPVVVSIFVNPKQFNDPKDFEKYPSDPNNDRRLLEGEGVDILYAPTTQQIYPPGFSTCVKAGSLAQILEGPFRPGHFDGVATVVTILLNQVRPTFAVFGEKDFQQLQVVKQLVRDLSMPIEICSAPIMREGSGLAMSSRNSRLSEQGKIFAGGVHKTVTTWAKTYGPAEDIISKLTMSNSDAKELLETSLKSLDGVTLEYVEVIDQATLAPVDNKTKSIRVLLAVFVEGVRLIDAVAVNP